MSFGNSGSKPRKFVPAPLELKKMIQHIGLEVEIPLLTTSLCGRLGMFNEDSTKDEEGDTSSISEKSKEKYMIAYDNFVEWKTKKGNYSFSEDIFLEYFSELAEKYKPPTLWCTYSMIRNIVMSKNRIDIKTYSNLLTFLKKRNAGYTGRKSKVLSPTDVAKFLKEAPDDQYLATKVALIFGVAGSCRRQELYNIKANDVETHGEMLLVRVTNPRNKIPRSFTVHGPYHDIVRKYQGLRSTKTKSDHFFQNFQKGKCTAQIIGINKFGSMPKEVAKYLGLPDANLYTGHSFKRTSASATIFY